MTPPKDKDQEPLLLEHEADGIRELDNLLPRWWAWLFHLSIAFSIGYMFYYHVFEMGDLQEAAYAKEAERGEKIKTAALARFENSLAELAPLQDQGQLAAGQQLFLTYCAPCHRQDGGGLVGPNLTDDYWIHGDTYHDNLKTIIQGVPEKGMLSWRGVLKPEEIQAVASFIYTLRGTNPDNPKAPENQQPVVDAGPSDFE